jgi:hypothetical protein
MIGRLIPRDKLEKQDGENWDPHILGLIYYLPTRKVVKIAPTYYV